MNRPLLTLLLATCATAGVARGQPVYSPTVAQPTSAAPHVVTTSTSSSEGTTPGVVQVPANTAPTNITQIVYSPQLPNAADLTNAANAQGLTVERIVQTANQVVAFYRNANGQTSTVAYQSLPPTGPSAAPAPAPNVVVTSPPPAVVYQPAPVYQAAPVYQPAPPRVVYYETPSYYYPRVWYPPVSFSFGLGYRGGYNHYRGHHHHGGRYYHRR